MTSHALVTLLRIVTLATDANASAAFRLQLARNHTALHHAAISAVSRIVSFPLCGAVLVGSSISSRVCSGARGDPGGMENDGRRLEGASEMAW